jgi:hypothetical protein
MFKFEYSLWTFAAHVLDGVLVAYVVGSFYGVIHMPAPVIQRIFTGNSAGNSTLSGNCMGACGKHFGDDSSLEAGLGELQGRSQSGAAAANDYTVKGKNSELGQDLYTPENLHTPHEVSEQHQ